MHDRYKEVVQGCENCVKKKPPLQRSKVSGLRSDNFGDIVFIDHANVKIRSETYTVFIVVEGATTFVTAFLLQERKTVMKMCNVLWHGWALSTVHRRVFVQIWLVSQLKFNISSVVFGSKPFSRVLTHHGRIEQKRQSFQGFSSRSLCSDRNMTRTKTGNNESTA